MEGPARPRVPVGGIQDQIVHGESGLLLDDLTDLDDFADRLLGVIRDEDLPRDSAAQHTSAYATDSSATGILIQYAQLFQALHDN